MFVNVGGHVSSMLPPPETVFSEAFVSPNGAWNILNMIRNSNKMNNTRSQPARAFDEALNENTEPHQRVIKANIWKCQRQMSDPAEADEWAPSSVGSAGPAATSETAVPLPRTPYGLERAENAGVPTH